MQNTTVSPPLFVQPFVPFGLRHHVNGQSRSHQTTIVSLWKRQGSLGDFNNHRGICLISLWGRVLGRIVAARLARYAEQQGILDTTQWGFREARSTHGALAVARRVLDAATKPFGSQVLDPCCVEPLDLKKAYPNSSRNAFLHSVAPLWSLGGTSASDPRTHPAYTVQVPSGKNPQRAFYHAARIQGRLPSFSGRGQFLARGHSANVATNDG